MILFILVCEEEEEEKSVETKKMEVKWEVRTNRKCWPKYLCCNTSSIDSTFSSSSYIYIYILWSTHLRNTPLLHSAELLGRNKNTGKVRIREKVRSLGLQQRFLEEFSSELCNHQTVGDRNQLLFLFCFWWGGARRRRDVETFPFLCCISV